MRTKEEVLEHLKTNGYSPKALNKIHGFLLGNGMLKYADLFDAKRGYGSYSNFMQWWENEPQAEDESPLATLFADLFERLSKCETEAEKDRVNKQLSLLVKGFIIDKTTMKRNDDDVVVEYMYEETYV
jgi:hypothetical protein